MSGEVKTVDRERMASDLATLGFYAVSSDVRRGRWALTKGVAYVSNTPTRGEKCTCSGNPDDQAGCELHGV